ncbi:MAG: 2'-deoxycytidine 5'-triphosphate deaminase [Candidatus Aenigmatarchaeota archaeon]|nr:MAG: 2'-deoxycytidine 5'-triphosphate deaminase [Candidatus Aenigmarchaeota archaeon]
MGNSSEGILTDREIVQYIIDKGLLFQEDGVGELIDRVGPTCLDMEFSNHIGRVDINKGKAETLPLDVIKRPFPAGFNVIDDGRSSFAGKPNTAVEVRGEGGAEVNREYEGRLYAVVNPLTFNIRVREGTSIPHLRFMIGYPEECRLRPEDVVNYGEDGNYIGREPVIKDGKLVMGLRLRADNRFGQDIALGLRSIDTDERVDYSRVNPIWNFWTAVDPCDRSVAEDGYLYLFRTSDAFFVGGYKEPFVAEMLSVNSEGLQVNGAKFIEKDSGMAQQVVELYPKKRSWELMDRGDICELIFYRLVNEPLRTYRNRDGSNLWTLQGKLFGLTHQL